MSTCATYFRFVLSSHVLSGIAAGRDDFDVMFLEECKNWAAFDGINAKYDAIQSKIIGSEEKQVQLMTKRTDVREIFGETTRKVNSTTVKISMAPTSQGIPPPSVPAAVRATKRAMARAAC